MEFHQFHGYGRFSRKKVNFTETVTAVKSRIRLAHTNWTSVALLETCYIIG